MSNMYIERIEDCIERCYKDSNDEEIVVTELKQVEVYLDNLKGRCAGLVRSAEQKEKECVRLSQENYTLRSKIRLLEDELSKAHRERNEQISRVRSLTDLLERAQQIMTADQQLLVFPVEECDLPF